MQLVSAHIQVKGTTNNIPVTLLLYRAWNSFVFF